MCKGRAACVSSKYLQLAPLTKTILAFLFFFYFFWRLAYDNKLSSATSIHVNSCKRRCISVAFSVTRKATAGNTSAFVRGCSHFMGNSNNNSFITIEVAKIILTSGNFNVIESVEIEPKIEKQDQRHLQ